jgi:large subunit ribosomal protein L19
MNKINLVTTPQMRTDFPKFHSGDTVNIHVKVIEGDKERIQQYQGIVMGIKGSGIGRTFRVRKISNGVGVERIFPINSPIIAKIEKLKEGKVRRAKLYYLRNLKGKSATKIKERISPEIIAPVIKPDSEVEMPEINDDSKG